MNSTTHAKDAMFDEIKQNLIERMADFLDTNEMRINEAIAGVKDPMPRDESELHIRMANAAFEEYKKTVQLVNLESPTQKTLKYER